MSRVKLSKRLISGAALLAIAGLGGCATFDSALLDAQVAYMADALPAEWQVATGDAIRPQNWQSLFEDPLLAAFLTEADANNLDLEQAAARVRQSTARIDESRALLLPSVTADLTASGFTDLSDFDSGGESFGSNVSARWDPDLFGGNKAARRQAEALFQLQSANAERLRRVVLSQTARAYIQTVEADLQLALAEENLTFIAETKRVSEARFKAGDIARGDLALAELEFENAAASLENQQLAARQARRALSVLVGGMGADDLVVAQRLPRAAELGTAGVPATVLNARFDVLAARAGLAAQVPAMEATVADDWPSVALTGRIGGGGSFGDLFDIDSYIANLGAALAANLFDGGRNDARVTGAQASIDEAVSNYEQVLQGAVFDVNTALDQVDSLKRSLAALERASVSAQEALDLEEIKFDLGESILLDVLTVQRRVNAIQGSRISTERRLLEAQIAAYLALGSTG